MQTLSELVAFELHEAWRRPRLREDGTYEPRWKKIKDESFVEEMKKNDSLPEYIRINENGEYEIDIANTCYFNLSKDWQEENRLAGEVVARLVESGKDYSEAEVGEIIHSEWLARNSWAKDGELGVPFAELPADEQEKDLVQYRIAKKMAEATPYNGWVSDVDGAIRVLANEKAAGRNTYIEFNTSTRLYSLFDTADTCYLKVTGETKLEYEQSREKWRRDFEERQAQARQTAKQKAEGWYERGLKMIYPQKADKWRQCVESRVSDIYNGYDLVNALDIMEALEQGKSIEEATAIFDGAGHSGASAGMVLRIVVNFSKRGTEFYRANVDKEVAERNADALALIEATNATYAISEIKGKPVIK